MRQPVCAVLQEGHFRQLIERLNRLTTPQSRDLPLVLILALSPEHRTIPDVHPAAPRRAMLDLGVDHTALCHRVFLRVPFKKLHSRPPVW